MVHRHPAGRALILSFAAVAVVFTAGMAVSQLFSLAIRTAAREITGNSSPTISYLSSMRSALRQLEVLVTDHVNACIRGDCAPAPARVRDLRRLLRGEWLAYRQLPTFPSETDRWPQVEDELARLEEALTLTLAAAGDGDAAAASRLARTSVRPAFDQLDDSIATITDFDRAQGLGVASRIDELARDSVITSVLLDLISIALTALTGMLAIRFVRRNEQALRDRADDLDQFAGRVAHDIMSPLATTAAAIHLARRDAGEVGRTALDRGENGVRRVQRLVDGLLQFARAGAAHSPDASADVREVLEDVVAELRPVADTARVALHVDLAEALAVACSPGVLTSVTSNLVRNSITHMGPSRVRDVRIRAGPLEARCAVRIEVEDTGPGIPDELGERVFEPFVRGPAAGQQGSGLGLATAKRLVDAHGGRIGFHPGADHGTLFWFELPAAPASGDTPRA